ncbi:hypothetical protein RI367_000872 [Sorochytrium milnesiophthora]
MREPNVANLLLNRAAITITHTQYDRRALDVSDPLALINSLIHLAHLSASVPRVRNQLAHDGGIFRLVTITQRTRPTDTQSALLWITAYQVLANVIVKGSNRARVEAVKRGIIAVCVNVLSTFLKSWSAEVKRAKATASLQPGAASLPSADANNVMNQMLDGGNVIRAPSTADIVLDESYENGSTTTSSTETAAALHSVDRAANVVSPVVSQNLPSLTTPFHLSRHQDLLLTLQMLVKLTELPAVRVYLRNAPSSSCDHTGAAPRNVYAFLEPLTRLPQQHIRSLAITVMQNATLPVPPAFSLCGSSQQQPGSDSAANKVMHVCANLGCTKSELSLASDAPPCSSSASSQPCFARCSRCKKARYCSRECQVASWSTHRYWCVPGPAVVASSQSSQPLPSINSQSQSSQLPDLSMSQSQPQSQPLSFAAPTQSPPARSEPAADAGAPYGKSMRQIARATPDDSLATAQALRREQRANKNMRGCSSSYSAPTTMSPSSSARTEMQF